MKFFENTVCGIFEDYGENTANGCREGDKRVMKVFHANDQSTAMAALTEKCRYTRYNCRGGKQNSKIRLFCCRLDKKTRSQAL